MQIIAKSILLKIADLKQRMGKWFTQTKEEGKKNWPFYSWIAVPNREKTRISLPSRDKSSFYYDEQENE